MQELRAVFLVLGASSSGLLKRFSTGSVASALLCASTVPVVRAPSGYKHTKPSTRLSVAAGTRKGVEDVLRVGLWMAAALAANSSGFFGGR